VLCVSVNDEVIHGIPRANHVVKDGDIVSIDFGVNYHGMITDAARTFVVGNTNSANKLLIEKTEQALLAGIGVVKNNTRVGDVGAEIEQVLSAAKLGIVKDYVGHGVGHELHEEPNIPNYGRKGTGPKLESGMTIAIEPMATLGTDRVSIDTDGWTVRSTDGSMAAHFEDTVLVTDDGFEILTRSN
jgi:methionyl aminopeptidase